MSFNRFSVPDLIQIAAAGGGLTLNAKTISLNDLVRIAAAASTLRATLKLTSAGERSVSDLVKIAAAGKGCVVFEY
ncbi:hypothetical protein VITFI_CDS3433 (plasmid) [Vitreoscilla filiformis]|jgi:hypothetical protein|uniref:Uncharacterized protein n=1 Tax=Vitreoscilla filiformis TaxID=63 RepID=A0A221KK53_VITFI|nr:hypothetical protein [Vitreoscilla filiformis]ASM79210.1 hypothetical protein VITFI_CDS3433 [Vitreoscilla filiformis]